MNLPPEISALIRELSLHVAQGSSEDTARLLERAMAEILSKGYRILPPESATSPPAPAPVADAQRISPAEAELIDKLRRKKLSLGEIRDMWDQRTHAGWQSDESVHVLLGERLLGAGEPFFAHDVVAAGRKINPTHKRLRQLQALALARSGAPRAGRTLLMELLNEGHDDVETVSMLARTFKDMARVGKNVQERNAAMTEALHYYQRAFDSSQEYYPAINAATCAVLLGRREEAAALAARVLQLCDDEQARGGINYWLAATRAEATLIRGDLPQAVDLYREAAELARLDWGSLGSSRRQAETLLEHLGHDIKILRDCFPPCRIAMFSGTAMRGNPAWPAPETEAAFADKVRDYLAREKVRVGFSAGGDWRDIVFLECVLEKDGEVHLVFPGPEPRHGALPPLLVRGGDDDPAEKAAGWEARWQHLLHKATRVSYAHQPEETSQGGREDYSYLILQGLARLKSAVLSATYVQPTARDFGLEAPAAQQDKITACTSAVAESSKPAPNPEIAVPGATLDAGRAAPGSSTTFSGAGTAVIASASHSAPSSAPAQVNVASTWTHALKALLFADIVGYSKLSDHDVGLFMTHYVGGVARMLERTGQHPEVKNTWGDAFYFAFSSVREAGILALDLADFMKQVNAEELGLSARLRIRIGLHAGPVYRFVDPITGRLNYVGSHVSRAARIEPIAAEGQVYASESFAALAFAEDAAQGFACEYVGEMNLPKNFGKQRVYLLSRGE